MGNGQIGNIRKKWALKWRLLRQENQINSNQLNEIEI